MRARVISSLLAALALGASPAHAADDAYIRSLAPMTSAPAPICDADTKDNLVCDMQQALHVPRSPVPMAGKTRLSLRIYADPPFTNWTVMQFDVSAEGGGGVPAADGL